MFFGVIFVKRSFVIDSTQFQQVGEKQWVLNLRNLVGNCYADVKEVCLFVPNAAVLDNASAFSLYIQAGTSGWEYRGSVCNQRPSEVFPLKWPDSASVDGAAQIGISIEPIEEAALKEQQVVGAKEDFAKRVAMDLFRFMESFSGSNPVQTYTDAIVVPSNCLDSWFTKFQAKFRRDPDFLTRAPNMH